MYVKIHSKITPPQVRVKGLNHKYKDHMTYRDCRAILPHTTSEADVVSWEKVDNTEEQGPHSKHQIHGIVNAKKSQCLQYMYMCVYKRVPPPLPSHDAAKLGVQT